MKLKTILENKNYIDMIFVILKRNGIDTDKSVKIARELNVALNENVKVKLKTINEVSISSSFVKLFKAYPKNTTKWSQADDGIREIVKHLREFYEDFTARQGQTVKITPLNFRSFENPSVWNTESQKFIMKWFNKLPEEGKQEFLTQIKQYFPEYF